MDFGESVYILNNIFKSFHLVRKCYEVILSSLTEPILPIHRICTLSRDPETPLKDVLILVSFLSGHLLWKHEWSFILMRYTVTIST